MIAVLPQSAAAALPVPLLLQAPPIHRDRFLRQVPVPLDKVAMVQMEAVFFQLLVVLLLLGLPVLVVKPRPEEGRPDLMLAAVLLLGLQVLVRPHHLAEGQQDQMEVLVVHLKHRLLEEPPDLVF